MKPRLEVAPLTNEDVTAFWFVRKRSPRNLRGEDFVHAYVLPYLRADRRDADIMYDAIVRRTGWWAPRFTRKDRRWILAFGNASPVERYQ